MGKFIFAALLIALCLFAYTRINSVQKVRIPEGDFAEYSTREPKPT